ncbi:hypothetical protein FPOAC2_07103 [Fusarium poae]
MMLYRSDFNHSRAGDTKVLCRADHDLSGSSYPSSAMRNTPLSSYDGHSTTTTNTIRTTFWINLPKCKKKFKDNAKTKELSIENITTSNLENGTDGKQWAWLMRSRMTALGLH